MSNVVMNSVLFLHKNTDNGYIDVLKIDNNLSFDFLTDEDEFVGTQIYDNIGNLVNSDKYIDDLECLGSFKIDGIINFIYTIVLDDADFDSLDFKYGSIKISDNATHNLDLLCNVLFNVSRDIGTTLFSRNLDSYDTYKDMLCDSDYDLSNGSYEFRDITVKYLNEEIVIKLPFVSVFDFNYQIGVYFKPFTSDYYVEDGVVIINNSEDYSRIYKSFCI